MLDEAMDSTEEEEEDERRGATTLSSPRSALRIFDNYRSSFIYRHSVVDLDPQWKADSDLGARKLTK